MTPITKRKLKRRQNRRGAATVELAVCMPVILIIAFGSIEGANMIFLRQALVQSAYETVKEAVKTNGSAVSGLTRGQAVLSFRDIDGESIEFSTVSSPGPAETLNPVTADEVDNLPPGSLVVVTVTAPNDANSIIPFGPFQGRTISVRSTMTKE